MVRIIFKNKKATSRTTANRLGNVNFLGRPMPTKRITVKFKSYNSKHTAPAFGAFTTIPKVRSVSLFAPSMNRPAAAFWGDSDGDGVMNGFDCAPFNPRKQGPQHKHNKPMWPFEKAEREEQRKRLKERASAIKVIDKYGNLLKEGKVSATEHDVFTTPAYKILEDEDEVANRSDPEGSWAKELKETERRAHNKIARAYNASVLKSEAKHIDKEDDEYDRKKAKSR